MVLTTTESSLCCQPRSELSLGCQPRLPSDKETQKTNWSRISLRSFLPVCVLRTGFVQSSSFRMAADDPRGVGMGPQLHIVVIIAVTVVAYFVQTSMTPNVEDTDEVAARDIAGG